MDDCMLYICCTLVCLKDSGGQFAQVCATLLNTARLYAPTRLLKVWWIHRCHTGPISLLFCAKEHSASSKDDVDCERAKHPNTKTLEPSKRGRRRQFIKWRQMSKESKVLSYHTNSLRLYRYTIQTYPKCSVGWLVLSTAWFLRPQLLVPRKGIKPLSPRPQQATNICVAVSIQTSRRIVSQPSVDGLSQVERVELGPPGHTSQIFSSEKYLGSGGGNTFNWPIEKSFHSKQSHGSIRAIEF